MSNRPPLPWSRVLADLKSDRLRRTEVREERLRPAIALRGSPALALSGWRGMSGRRYVVGVHPIASFQADEAEQAVVLFVRRDADGIAAIAFGSRDLHAADVPEMVEAARRGGCTEVHVHRLAEDAGERAAILADLNATVLEVA